MTIIEGIGDEVTHFFIFILIVLVVTVAWLTTDIRPNFVQLRTVYLLDRRRLRRPQHQRLTNHTESVTIAESQSVQSTSTAADVNDTAAQETSARSKPPEEENAENGSASSSEMGSGSNTPAEIEEETEEIVRIMDGDVNTLRQRRVAFFQGGVENFMDPLEARNISHEYNDENRAMNEEASENLIQQQTATNSEPNLPTSNQTNITIKLKYINDDLRIVSGHLEELLGDFKKRHFEVELSSNKVVRLIFNGQVLQRDCDTLRSYGMFDNCVVHCLIHAQRNTNNDNQRSDDNSTSNNRNGSFNNNNNNNTHRDWDLGNLLIGTFSFTLGSAWYFRYHYPQLFTVTATVSLVAITGLFTVVSIGMYLPDAERLRTTQQQQQQQQHNNETAAN